MCELDLIGFSIVRWRVSAESVGGRFLWTLDVQIHSQFRLAELSEFLPPPKAMLYAGKERRRAAAGVSHYRATSKAQLAPVPFFMWCVERQISQKVGYGRGSSRNGTS